MASCGVKDLTALVLVTCLSVLFLPLFIIDKNASAATDLPFLQIEQKMKVVKALGPTDGSLTVQTIVGAGGGGTCEQCQFIVYKPTTSAPGKAGVAYVSETPIDLDGAKRLVFFAKGELGGEAIKPLIMGKASSAVSAAPFTNLIFEVENEDIVLASDWRRYEMNIDGLNLNNVTTPFALVISNQRGEAPDALPTPSSDELPNNNNNPDHISFYLKGVSLDDTAATNPINNGSINNGSINNGSLSAGDNINDLENNTRGINSTFSLPPSSSVQNGNITDGNFVGNNKNNSGIGANGTRLN